MSEPRSSPSPSKPAESFGRRILRGFLVSAVEIVARGVSRGLESMADDVSKIGEREKQRVRAWRQDNLGEVDVEGNTVEGVKPNGASQTGGRP